MIQPREDRAPREFHGPTERIRKGLLAVYTGEGKGKSTAGFGTVFRALGRGYRAGVVQFIKGEWVSGEVKALERFGDLVEYHAVGEGFTWNTKDYARDVACARAGWDVCLRMVRARSFHVLLFDELNYVLHYNFLPVNDVLAGLGERDPAHHVILTGRGAPPEILEAADLVTEMREVRHPFRKGILAQPGFDY